MEGVVNSALITGVISLITLAIKLYFAKYNAQKSEMRIVLEEQYQKVFAPLHKLLFYKRPEDGETLYSDIDQIISNQYYLIPQQIIKTYLNQGIEPVDNATSFEDYIDKCYNVAAAKLGYAQVPEKIYATKLEKLLARLRRSNNFEAVLDTLDKINNVVFVVSLTLTVIAVIINIIHYFAH